MAMKKALWWLTVAMLVGGIAAVLYLQWRGAQAPVPAPATIETPVPATAPPSYPLPERSAEPEVKEPPLPALGASDDPFTADLAELIGPDPVDQYLVTRQVVRQLVAALDNLTRQELPLKSRPVKPVPGQFTAATEGEVLVMDTANFARYAPLVDMVAKIDTAAVLDLYLRYYPLLQEAYAELGYPERQFNDRVVEVIDHLLQTPAPREPIRLVQPKVFYQFADPELERRSAGQKILLRMGNDNAAIVKTRLREFRAALTGEAPAA
jgi:hypothetical protein